MFQLVTLDGRGEPLMLGPRTEEESCGPHSQRRSFSVAHGSIQGNS